MWFNCLKVSGKSVSVECCSGMGIGKHCCPKGSHIFLAFYWINSFPYMMSLVPVHTKVAYGKNNRNGSGVISGKCFFWTLFTSVKISSLTIQNTSRCKIQMTAFIDPQPAHKTAVITAIMTRPANTCQYSLSFFAACPLFQNMKSADSVCEIQHSCKSKGK